VALLGEPCDGGGEGGHGDGGAGPAPDGGAAAPATPAAVLARLQDLLLVVGGSGVSVPATVAARAAFAAADGPRALLAALAEDAAAPAAVALLRGLLPGTSQAVLAADNAPPCWPPFAAARLAALALDPASAGAGVGVGAGRGSTAQASPDRAALALGLLRAGLAAGLAAGSGAAAWRAPLQRVADAACSDGGDSAPRQGWLDALGPAAAVELSGLIR
jgi:hypothetical protein